MWMIAEFLSMWVSRKEILHWEEEILKLLCLFFFVAFWDCLEFLKMYVCNYTEICSDRICLMEMDS